MVTLADYPKYYSTFYIASLSDFTSSMLGKEILLQAFKLVSVSFLFFDINCSWFLPIEPELLG